MKKNILIFNWNNVLTEVIQKLKGLGHNVYTRDEDTKHWKKMDVIVVWNEMRNNGWSDFIEKVQKGGKKVILVQHGRYGTSRIHPPFNEKVLSDIVCVWGENDKKRFMDCGTTEEKIRVVSSPILKHLIPRREHEGINVVFSPEHWDEEVVENAIVAGQLRRIPKVKIITKCLSGEQQIGIYDNPIESKRTSPEHLKIVAEVLAIADVVVAISESTFELLAESLDIPVVIAEAWMPKSCGGDDRYLTYHRITTEASYKVKDYNKIPEAVQYCLKHPEFLREERKRVSIGDGGKDVVNSVDNIVNVILDM